MTDVLVIGLSQLTCFAHQSAGVCKRSDWSRSVVGRHAAKGATRHQRCLRAEIRSTTLQDASLTSRILRPEAL